MRNEPGRGDIGPEGGGGGGEVLYEGIPKGMIDVKESFTAKYLKEEFAKS